MAETADWPQIVAAMRAGGYWARVMAAGPELDRVKQYLRAFEASRASPPDAALDPHYPLFPGLGHRPFHDSHPAVALLEAAAPAIAAEAAALDDDSQLDYTIASAPVRRLRDPAT